jgi:hypothetical protein
MGRKRTVKECIGARAKFLGDYRLASYVKSSQIEDVSVDGTRCKAPASVFFKDKASLLLTVDGKKYKKPFNVILFDSFIVIEIAPHSLETKFLVLVPNFESKTGSYVLDAASPDSSVLDTLNALKRSRGYADLVLEAANLLAALQSPAAR